MKQYPLKKLRNVVLLGHGGDGKTSLAEAMLFLSKGTDRLGSVYDGTTVSDFDSEEIKRQISISTSIIPVEWKDNKINLIDTPGYFDFVGEVMQGLRVADSALILLSGKSGIQVGTEKSFKLAKSKNLVKFFLISKIDEENSDFYKVLDDLSEKYGKAVCPVILPYIEGRELKGYVDLLNMKAYKVDGKVESEMPIPESMSEKIEKYLTMIKEAVAETSEEMMEKYFGGEEFTVQEIKEAFKTGTCNSEIFPVFCTSATTNYAIGNLLDDIIELMPAPDERGKKKAELKGEQVEFDVAENAPPALIIFKTIADPFVGKMSFFKTITGTVKNDMTLLNTRTGSQEKLGHLYFIKGKKQVETTAVSAGDIAIITKLVNTQTGDSLCAPEKPYVLPGIDFPKPELTMAIVPKAKGDEEKISTGLNRLLEEDRTFQYTINTETKQQLVSGMGDIQLDVIVSKLKNKFGTAVELSTPRVAYRETIKKKVKVEGKHKKQSGGHGQFGHVWIEFEHGDEPGLTFADKVFGGAVPKNFFPAVEKGLLESINKGVLAGYPVVNLKATLVDGSYHPVDSSEMAFKVAASLAYKAGLAQAGPVLLEPVGSLKVYIPDNYMGDVIGDLNKRRGRVLGMNPGTEGQIIEAEVPMAEMHTYSIDLRSMTQGRGSFEIEFNRYEEAPPMVAQKVIEEAKKLMESDE